MGTKLIGEMEVVTRNHGMKYRADYANDGENGYFYEGWAIEPQYATSDAKWQIIKHTKSSHNVVASDWADGTDKFMKVWDDRASYTY